jgi:hypothetical protein
MVFSTNFFHQTWHIVTSQRGAQLLARLLWAISFERHPGTLLLIHGKNLAPTPFEAERFDPFFIVPGWQDVNWEKNRILIHAPKQEHHADGGDRWIPIFPELRPHLEECFDLADAGAVYVITRYRDSENTNLPTQLQRIIKRAGLKPWPKLFHNLRASRETELAQTYPLHTVCEWIGNSARIASAHYLQVTEAEFERASQGGAESGALEGLCNALTTCNA